MDDKNEGDKVDDVMLPGFRFHPTDEELVSFYLKKKIQQRPLPIELIKQVDIYKYDPWDLPNLASTGEKEWYFYCPRDRKYRNSTRPNRVTGAGFWKATGTDRPIYSSDSTKCIGLKKSLVFYRGRAAKGIKTDWMMHEFRLPSIPDIGPPKKFLDKSLSPHDSWAICRIFKKANSMAQRALSQSWVSPIPETTASDMFAQGSHTTQFSSESMLCNDLQHNSFASFPALDIPSYRPINPTFYKPLAIPNGEFHNGFLFSPLDMSGPSTFNLSPDSIEDASKTSESTDFGGRHQPFNNFSIGSPEDMQGSMGTGKEDAGLPKNHCATNGNNQWGNIRSLGFPFSLPWDSPSCPSEMSTTYPSNKCLT